ncbi:MAG: diguanylate cyclase domain-containing protein [Frankia sp.]
MYLVGCDEVVGPAVDDAVREAVLELATGVDPVRVLGAVVRCCVALPAYSSAEIRTPSGVAARALAARTGPGPTLDVPVRYGDEQLGTLHLVGMPGRPDSEDEIGWEHDPDRDGGVVAARAPLDRSVLTLAGLAGLILRLNYSAEQLADETARVRTLCDHVAQLRDAALSDPLTGLANRTQLAERLRQALARAGRWGIPVGLLMVDLDEFKAVNDLYGHAAGDAVLREVAGRLEACTRPSDTVARLGGDEFVILLEDVGRADRVGDDGAVSARNAADRDLAQAEVSVARIAHRVTGAVRVSAGGIVVGASVGYAIGTGETDAADLMAAADASMYGHKRARWL